MKKVTLKWLHLTNFKGIRSLTVGFGPEQTTIAGDNATGKTTIFDAFTWCLFGKDAHGKTDFELKTKQNGVVIPKIEHEVTAILEVNGEEVSLTRTLNEDWVKPRGKAEPELKGNTTHYLVNGVEIKAKDYADRIAGIIDEQLFKLITNPAYFPSLHWEKQREILLTIAGGVTYEEVAKDRADFLAILSQLGGKDLMEFKQGISYRKKKIKEELDKSPIEINAIDSVTPVAPDYEALEAEKTRITNELEQVDGEITNVAETARKHYEKVQEKHSKVNELKSKQQDLLFKAKQAAQKEVFEKNEARNTAKNELEALMREAKSYETNSHYEIATFERDIKEVEGFLEKLHAKRASKLREWEERNADEYKVSNEGLICPIYKTLCSDASVLKMDYSAKAQAKANFEATKDSDLTRITNEGKAINEEIKEATQRLETLKAELSERIQARSEKTVEYNKKIEATNEKIAANPEVEVNTNIEPSSLPAWADLESQIEEITATIEELPERDTSELTAKKKALTAELDEVKRQLEVKAVIEKNNKRKDEILKREKELAQQMADLEKEEFAIDELNKARIDEVERRVNSKFQNVRFQMYEKQLNGGEKEVCNILIGGVKYGYGANRAAEINAGLDIINTLSLYHGVTAPVFIDNAESVNTLFPVASQLIKLVVTTEKELTVKPF